MAHLVQLCAVKTQHKQDTSSDKLLDNDDGTNCSTSPQTESSPCSPSKSNETVTISSLSAEKNEHSISNEDKALLSKATCALSSPQLKKLFAAKMTNKVLSSPKSTLATLLIFLKNNQHYDPVLCMCLATESWRWETLQYLATSRGLMLEKLALLLAPCQSSGIDSDQQISAAGKEYGNSSSFETSSSMFYQHTSIINHRFILCRENESGYLHCFSDPEIRSVLLIKPELQEMHSAIVVEMLPRLSVSVLERLAALYDPSHPVLTPFLSRRDSDCCRSAAREYQHLSSLEKEPLKPQALVEVFLKIVIRLNELRGWKFRSDLVKFASSEPKPAEPVSAVINLFFVVMQYLL